jgi:hypothetical protein
MSERCELEVLGISYVGPHCVDADNYEIGVQVQPAPGRPWSLIVLRFRPAEATFLARAMHANPPQVRVDDHLLEQVAAHDT